MEITNGVSKLTKQDCQPNVLLDGSQDKCFLVTTRLGNPHTLEVSKDVAAELIAMGLGYGS